MNYKPLKQSFVRGVGRMGGTIVKTPMGPKDTGLLQKLVAAVKSPFAPLPASQYSKAFTVANLPAAREAGRELGYNTPVTNLFLRVLNKTLNGTGKVIID